MTSVIVRGVLALSMLALCSMATGQARDAEADRSTWGVYSRLVGTSWQGESGKRSTRWGEGNQIIEDDSTFGQSVITPGPTPGTLTLKLGSTGLHTFQGTIASDGSVLWIRDGMIKMPYRVLLRDDELVEEAIKLKGREVASVKSEMRFRQVDGPRLASGSTSGPAAQATAPTPATLGQPIPAGQSSTNPTASSTPVPSNLDGLRTMLGKMFLGSNMTIEFPAGPDVGVDNFTLRYGNYLDANTTTFTFRSTGQPGVYDVTRQPLDGPYTNYTGTVEADGTLVFGYQPIVSEGYTYQARYRANGSGLVETQLALRDRWLGRAPEVTTQAVNEFLPYSPEQYKWQADWLVMERQIMGTPEEQAQRQAQEARQARIESDQALGRAFNSMLSDLAQTDTGGYAEAQANLDAAVAGIQQAAAAERAAPPNTDLQASTRVPDYRAGASESIAQETPERVYVSPPEPSATTAAMRSSTETASPSASGPVEMFVFFVNIGGRTVAFEGPLALSRAEGRAMKARLESEAPGRYGAGATIDARSRGGGWCAFVYQRPGEERYIMGSETTLATTTKTMKGMVSNLNAVIHHDVVCP